MPELPEVENVKLSLIDLGSIGQRFDKIELRREGLRVPFPRGISARLRGQTVRAIHRRAKFLLIETEKFYLLNHLGMTGSWRSLRAHEFVKHDHLVMHFASGLKLVFNDPRRFGLVDLIPHDELAANRWLKHLGIEPLDDEFTGDFLFKHSRRVKAPIKAFLMDQRRIVGVGNIYASEALFKAGVRPTRAAGKITRSEAEVLVECVRVILRRAISAGGSTIRDYRNSQGEQGQFQAQFAVYDRAGEACVTCGAKIRSQFIAGRNTFWCPKCQR
jgi:formamidopyrimidine-DNA glycosylase